MKVECMRYYGQPKLVKPKECNNKNLLGSVRFSFGKKPVKCKVWLCNNLVYVLHRDWFSDFITFDEAEKRGLIKPVKNKFVYRDNFGGVLLRNEAVLSFSVPDTKEGLLKNRFLLTKEFSEMLGVNWADLYNLHRWEDFFEEIIELLQAQN